MKSHFLNRHSLSKTDWENLHSDYINHRDINEVMLLTIYELESTINFYYLANMIAAITLKFSQLLKNKLLIRPWRI